MKTLVVRFGLNALGSWGFAGPRSLILKSRLLACVLSLLLLVGCGAGGTSLNRDIGGGATPPAAPPSSTAVLIKLGEFAAVPGDSGPNVDRIVSFELTIDSVGLRSSHGDVSLLSTPRRFELSRLASKFEPLLLSNGAQGDYSAVVIAVSNPEVSFIDSSGVLHQDVAASLTSSIETMDFPLSIGSTPMAINLLPLAESVSFGGGNVVTVTPRFGGSAPAFLSGVEDLVGRVTAVGSSSFTIDVGNGTFTFATDPNIEFQGLTALSELEAGMTVEVDAVVGSDATLLVNRIKLESDVASALVVDGLTISLALAQLQMLVRDVHGSSGVTLPGVGKALTVDTNASTQFRLEPDHVDLNNLDFTPTFNALTIAPGQNVRAATAGGDVTTITADELKLEEQSLDGIAGTVTAGSVSGQFTVPLNLAAASAFAQLTGHTSVVVILQPSTELFIFNLGDCVTCITGQPVRVRGLLFFSGGQYRLVAERLAQN